MLVVGLALSIAGLAGCSKDEPSVTPTPEATPAATAGPRLSATPCSRADGTIVPCRLQVPTTVWLVDARDGAVRTVYESDTGVVRSADFDSATGEAILGVEPEAGSDLLEAIRFNLGGAETGREPWPIDAKDRGNALLLMRVWRPGDPFCLTVDGGAEVNGRRYDGIACGPVSPDGRWMTYGVQTDEVDAAGRPILGGDVWAIDLTSDERWQVQAGLHSCQGDSFFRAEWSPSGRYRFFGDCRDGGRVFLSDMVRRATRQIGTGLPVMRSRPDWSPAADVLLYQGNGGVTVLEDFRTGALTSLFTVGWPARFDVAGAYVYSPPGATPRQESPGGPTTIFEVASGRVVAALPGRAVYPDLYLGYESLAGTGSGFVAALQEAPGCDGTAVYAGATLAVCVKGAAGAVVSPGGRYVALARKTGETGLAHFPGGGSVSMNRYEIVVVNVSTGTERVVAKDALGLTHPPLAGAWNAEGTHFLVSWPFSYGP